MDNDKLKVKIAGHEFEAEGRTEIVQSRYEAFLAAISALPSDSATTKSLAVAQPDVDTGSSASASSMALDKITRVDGRYVSLTARPDTIEDALLLVLLGQRTFRSNDSVTGSELLDGLRQSGMNVGRVDWRLEKMATEGLIIKIGSGRASKYRLTNQGVSRSQEMARNLIAMVP
jgi:hypothetical protein